MRPNPSMQPACHGWLRQASQAAELERQRRRVPPTARLVAVILAIAPRPTSSSRHCGSVKLKLPSTPSMATDCNCSLCGRFGGPWGYFQFGTVEGEGVATKNSST